MQSGTEIIKLLSQIAVLAPFGGTLQPALLITQQILERAQTLSAENENLRNLSVKVARLSLTIHTKLAKYSDIVTEDVRSNLDEFSHVLQSISKALEAFQRLPKWKRVLGTKQSSVDLDNLHRRLKDATNELLMNLSLENNVGIGKSLAIHNATFHTVSEMRQQSSSIVELSGDETEDTGLRTYHRSDFFLQGQVWSIRTEQGDSMQVVTMKAKLKDQTPVVVRMYRGKGESASPSSLEKAKKKFQRSLEKKELTMNSRMLQVIGKSSDREKTPYLIYTCLDLESRAPFFTVLQDLLKRDDNLLTMTLISQLPSFFGDWKGLVASVPCLLTRETWVDGILKLLHDLTVNVDLIPSTPTAALLYTGEVCDYEWPPDSDQPDSEYNWNRFFTALLEILVSRFNMSDHTQVVRLISELNWQRPTSEETSRLLIRRGPIGFSKQLFSPYMTPAARPVLLIDEEEFDIGDQWFRTMEDNKELFWTCYWDEDLECHRGVWVVWNPETEFGQWWTYCRVLCKGRRHLNSHKQSFNQFELLWV